MPVKLLIWDENGKESLECDFFSTGSHTFGLARSFTTVYRVVYQDLFGFVDRYYPNAAFLRADLAEPSPNATYRCEFMPYLTEDKQLEEMIEKRKKQIIDGVSDSPSLVFKRSEYNDCMKRVGNKMKVQAYLHDQFQEGILPLRITASLCDKESFGTLTECFRYVKQYTDERNEAERETKFEVIMRKSIFGYPREIIIKITHKLTV